jgi:hypothetical protein
MGQNRTLTIPVQQIVDGRAKLLERQLRRFADMWAEATRDFSRCGIQFDCTRIIADVRRSPSGAPVFQKLADNVINLVITDRIPTQWDNGRGLSGVMTRYEGFHLCVIALDHAHGHQIPFLSVNTCVHELLHALLQDVYELRPKGFTGEAREMRVDALATRMWLFHDCSTIYQSAQVYLKRLQAVH